MFCNNMAPKPGEQAQVKPATVPKKPVVALQTKHAEKEKDKPTAGEPAKSNTTRKEPPQPRTNDPARVTPAQAAEALKVIQRFVLENGGPAALAKAPVSESATRENGTTKGATSKSAATEAATSGGKRERGG